MLSGRGSGCHSRGFSSEREIGEETDGLAQGGDGGCAVVQGLRAHAGEAEVLVAHSGVRAVPDAAERDVDVRGDSLQPARLPRGLRVLHVPVPDPHRLAAQLVLAGVLLRRLLGRGAQQPVASLPALSRGDGHASGDYRAGHRHRQRLGAAGGLLGQIRRALLAGRHVRVSLHCAGLHPVRLERHVRRCALLVRRLLHADSLRIGPLSVVGDCSPELFCSAGILLMLYEIVPSSSFLYRENFLSLSTLVAGGSLLRFFYVLVLFCPADGAFRFVIG